MRHGLLSVRPVQHRDALPRPPALGVGAGPYAAAVIFLEARAEQLPPAPDVDPDGEAYELKAEGESYEAARAALDAQVPDGHRLIWVRSGS